MLKDTHIDIKFSLAGEKKQYHLTFAECFLENTNHWMQISVLQKHQPLAG